jgi:Zn-dependent protease
LSPLEKFLLVVPVLLFSMVAHEYAHGYAALRQGDKTALLLGRLTWNPLKHIDPIMTLIMPLITFKTMGVAFGGAKPVPVDPRNYRDYRRGDIIVSLAGIVTNFAIAVILTLVIIPIGLIGRALPGMGTSLALLQLMFFYGIVINLLLAGFNLIPIPPLDGSHVMKHLLPPKLAWQYQRFGRYGILLLLGLLWFGNGATINWLMQPVTFLQSVAVSVVRPFVLASPWTT